jgi:hypothetical protein
MTSILKHPNAEACIRCTCTWRPFENHLKKPSQSLLFAFHSQHHDLYIIRLSSILRQGASSREPEVRITLRSPKPPISYAYLNTSPILDEPNIATLGYRWTTFKERIHVIQGCDATSRKMVCRLSAKIVLNI